MNGYFFWAGHDCTTHEVTISVKVPAALWQFDREANGFYTSSTATQVGDAACEGDVCVLEFDIRPDNPKLGISFPAVDGDKPSFPWEIVGDWRECPAKELMP